MSTFEIITAATSLLLGGGWLLQVIKGYQEREKRQVDVESKGVQIALDSATEWKGIAERREVQIEKMENTISRLYSEKREDREMLFSLQKENADLRVRETEMSIKLCNIKACTQRQPQSGY